MHVQGHRMPNNTVKVVESQQYVQYLMVDAQHKEAKVLQQCHNIQLCWSTGLISVMKFLWHNSSQVSLSSI